jgi:hypothetical protein
VTESQQILYGGAMWVGPLFLGGYLLLYWWLNNAPFTARGKRKVAARDARSAAERARRLEPPAGDDAGAAQDDPASSDLASRSDGDSDGDRHGPGT